MEHGRDADAAADGTRYLLRTDGITWRELDEQIVVLDLQESLYLSVAGAGTVVWKLLLGGTTLDAMIDAVTDVYDVEPGVARADLGEFLDDLSRRTLLVSGAQLARPLKHAVPDP